MSAGQSPRVLAILGSGETAPTMIKPHRALFDRLGPDVGGVMLDTPFGFQANADELSEKTVEYFRQSVGRTIQVARLRRTEGVDPLEVERAFSLIRQAHWLFAGPGSPTYALRQWRGTPVRDMLADRLSLGGVVVFASAAALTLGSHTVPVYEVYKVGYDPFWLDGLDLLRAHGINAAVIPHFDNAEGGHHDTRFCYLGEPRLRRLEAELPADTFVLGVDEHTGVVLDLEAETAAVIGLGRLTLRTAHGSLEVPSGETVSLDVVRSGGRGGGVVASIPSPAQLEPDQHHTVAVGIDPDLGAAVARLEAQFDVAMGAADALGAVAAMLELDQAMVDWSKDSSQNEHSDRARAAMRSMMVRLGNAATEGLRDPRTVLSPVVEAALKLRSAVRAEKRYDLSDLLRDGLIEAGIEVRDTPTGVAWELTDG